MVPRVRNPFYSLQPLVRRDEYDWSVYCMSQMKPWWHRAREKARDAWEMRKSELVLKRRAEHEEITPVLRSMPWIEIVAGRSHIRDIETFIRYFEMYVPLLAQHKAALVNARDSGIYEGFELYASADLIKVTGVTNHGLKKVIVVVTEHYWEDLYTFRPHHYSPW